MQLEYIASVLHNSLVPTLVSARNIAPRLPASAQMAFRNIAIGRALDLVGQLRLIDLKYGILRATPFAE